MSLEIWYRKVSGLPLKPNEMVSMGRGRTNEMKEFSSQGGNDGYGVCSDESCTLKTEQYNSKQKQGNREAQPKGCESFVQLWKARAAMHAKGNNYNLS